MNLLERQDEIERLTRVGVAYMAMARGAFSGRPEGVYCEIQAGRIRDQLRRLKRASGDPTGSRRPA